MRQWLVLSKQNQHSHDLSCQWREIKGWGRCYLPPLLLTYQPSLGCNVFCSINVKSYWYIVSEVAANDRFPAPSKWQRSQRHQVFSTCHFPWCKYNDNLHEYLHWMWSWDETCILTSHNVKGSSTLVLYFQIRSGKMGSISDSAA